MPARTTPCPDCSDTLRYGGWGLLRCPGCGGLFRKRDGSRLTHADTRRHDRWVIGWAVALGALSLALAVVLSSDSVAASLAGVSPVPLRPVVDADLGPLLAEWEENPVATSQKYRGYHVRITGYVTSFDRHWNPYIEVSPWKRREPAAQVEFHGPWLAARLRDYPIGSRITLIVRVGPADSRLKCGAVAIEAAAAKE